MQNEANRFRVAFISAAQNEANRAVPHARTKQSQTLRRVFLPVLSPLQNEPTTSKAAALSNRIASLFICDTLKFPRVAARVSEALVLRAYPLKEADLVVSFLTRDQGRLRAVAKRARARPRTTRRTWRAILVRQYD